MFLNVGRAIENLMTELQAVAPGNTSSGGLPALTLTSGLICESTTDNITAKASGNQTTATLLTSEVNRITTVATLNDAVKLPPTQGYIGAGMIVINHGANAMQVYGSGTDTINDVATATGVSQMVNSVVLYFCTSAGKWYTDNLANGFTGSLQTFSYQDAMSANSGGVQAGATAITTMIARFTTVGGAGYSAVLPTAAAGLQLTIINAAAANAMNVFPATGDAINNLGANNAYSLPAGAVMELFCTVAGQWHTVVSRPSTLPAAQFVTNTTTTTFAAGQLTGADFTVYANTANTPGTVNTRTAAQMFADTPNAFAGQTYMLRIYHGGTGTLTIGAGSNVTLTGTMTIATTTFRDFVVTFTDSTHLVIQNVGSGTA